MATEAAWLNGNNLKKKKTKKKKDKMKESLDTHRPSHGRTCGVSNVFDDSIASVLGWGCCGQSDVREASLKHHFKFNAVGTHYAGTFQDAAIQLETADTMLVN